MAIEILSHKNKLFPNMPTNSSDIYILNTRNELFKPNLIDDKSKLQLITEENIKYYSHHMSMN